MIAGIKECHIKKFSRLVQELEQLRKDIKEYCPEVVYRLSDTSILELGIDSDDGDYPYIVQEMLYCDSINDVGDESYCIIDEDKQRQLSYSKTKRGSSISGKKVVRIKKGSKRYQEEVYPYWNGYRNGFGNLTEEQFALLHLGIELYD